MLQLKLTVGAADDEYEREAEGISRQVVGTSEAIATLRRTPLTYGERAASTAMLDRAEPASSSPDGFDAGAGLETQLDGSKGRGSPLAASIRGFMEPRFGHDFRAVRVHTGTDAEGMAEAVDAQAFTVGHDVYFGQGHGPSELALTAHELAHVVQQTGGAPLQPEPSNAASLEAAHGRPAELQRVHVDGAGRKQFDCAAFAGDGKLEACLNNEDRLSPGERGPSVVEVQEALLKDGEDLGPDGADGIYGSMTGQAVMAFKAKYHLGFESFPDVGPGTMAKLDQLCAGGAPLGPAPAPPGPAPPGPGPTPTARPVHYAFEIKAWIPFAHVPDPEEPLHETAFRAAHASEFVDDYVSQYQGDAHSGYAGGYRVLHVVEFDWDGARITNVTLPAVDHFGTSHRDFSAVLRDMFAFPVRSRFFHSTDTAKADHAVRQSVSGHEVDLGMSSPNPLTIFPAPDIDADYSIFISQDTFGIETVTVRWTTDLMPNHGYRVRREGVVVKEQITNALPGPIGAVDIGRRLVSKTNGGAATFEPAP